jgi:hypothetical protein
MKTSSKDKSFREASFYMILQILTVKDFRIWHDDVVQSTLPSLH